ncbi:MAG: PAS domain-containing protein [Fibromonadales bacterium]|nr:PAS domain-containing protein [Fibromonadales bacterium]
MTLNENINEREDALCVTNTAGRIVGANRRFCKMFGFEPSEVRWHYLRDLYRHADELSRALKKAPEYSDVLQTRMRNRSGRSFRCVLTRWGAKSQEGIPILMHSIQRTQIA